MPNISAPTSGGCTTDDCVRYLWTALELPEDALQQLHLHGGDDIALPSSFKIGHLAQASIAITGLLAALLHARRGSWDTPQVSIDRQHAVAEFQSEKLYKLNGTASQPPWGSIGGLHKAADGYVRMHDSFINHREAALKIFGCSSTASRDDVAKSILELNNRKIEQMAKDEGAVIFALRNYAEWDATPQGKVVPDFPVSITKVADSKPRQIHSSAEGSSKALAGIRVLEMSRVIAAPVGGKTLAVHGADVLWITSPKLPDLPDLDRDLSRGKRTSQLDLNQAQDKAKLLELLQEADVFLQSYRPGSLAKRGLSINELLKGRDRPLICATLSAWGKEGPWADRRGFDSIVQTASGMNVSEAEHYGDGSVARPMPCQALDHGAGYFLAAGIMTALYRQRTEGGSYQVDVSLAGVMKYLRSLGQYEGQTGFKCSTFENFEDVPVSFTETRDCAFGQLQSIRHSVEIEAVEVGWDHMPKPLGFDKPEWLPR